MSRIVAAFSPEPGGDFAAQRVRTAAAGAAAAVALAGTAAACASGSARRRAVPVAEAAKGSVAAAVTSVRAVEVAGSTLDVAAVVV